MRYCAIGVMVAALALGCDRDPTHGKLGESSALLATVPLAEVPGGSLEPPAVLTRIVVDARGVHVDNAARFASWPRPERERLLRALPAVEAEELPFFHRDLVRLDHGKPAPPDDLGPKQFLIPPLSGVLEYAMGIEKAYAEAADTREEGVIPDHRANLYFDRETPYGLVLRVLFTVGYAEMAAVPVARGPRGEVALLLEDPGRSELGCKVPALTLSSSEVSVVVGDGRPRIRVDDGALGAPAPREACSSVRALDGGVDVPRLTALLKETAKAEKGCGVAQIAATPEVPWREVVVAMGAAAEAGYPRALMAFTREGRTGCGGG